MVDGKMDESLERGGVRFSKDSLAQIDRGRPVIRVPREHIQRVALRWGLQAARPLVQGALGIGLLLAGCIILGRIISELMTQGGKVEGYLLVGLAVVALLGGWLFFESFRRGHYLEVVKRVGTEKIRFDRQLSHAEIEEFLSAASLKLGWIIDRDLPLERAPA